MGKADRILESYQSQSYDAINLSLNDVVLGIPFLRKKQESLRLPFISTNLAAKETGEPLFNPFITKKIGETAITIFGLMEQPLPRKADSTYMVTDPYGALRKMISSLKGKADLNIVLSSLSSEENVKLLEEFPDIHFVISTDKRTHAPTRVKNGYILSSGDKGMYLGRLAIRFSSLERPLRLQDMNKRIMLESNLTSLEQRTPKLEENREAILKSDNDQTKKRFDREIERLQGMEKRYREELAQLDKVKDSFVNATIPLAAKQSEKAPDVSASRRTRGKSMAKKPPAPNKESHIKVEILRTEEGREVTFVLLIDQAPNQVRALGFDVVYNPKVLKYSKYAKGELVNKFDMFDASKVKEGLLRVGGFEAQADFIQLGKSGELIRLHFEVIGEGNLDLHLGRLKDDISSWGAESAQRSRKGDTEDESELKKIQEAIKESGAEWEAGDTSVSDLSPEEKERRLGLKKRVQP